MQQSPIPYSNQRYNVWKRLAIFLIDALMSFGIFLGLFYTIGIFSIKSIAYQPIQDMNQIMNDVLISEHIPASKEDKFGLIELDYDSTMDKLISQGLDVEKANEKYYELKAKVEKKVSEDLTYHNAYVKFYTTYSLASILSLTLPLFIFQFLIPIFTKKHQTIPMLLFKSALVDSKSGVGISNIKVLLRFVFMLTVEYLTVYMLLNWIGLVFVCLVSFATISIMNNRSSLHDLTLGIKMVNVDQIYSE